MVRVSRSFLSVRGATRLFCCAFLLFYEIHWSCVASLEVIVISFIKLLVQNFDLRYPRAVEGVTRAQRAAGMPGEPSLVELFVPLTVDG
jgi:hypothetical protein